MKTFFLLLLLILPSCSSRNTISSGGFETIAFTSERWTPIARATLTETERQQVNAWLKECCSFSARSLVSFAPSICCYVDGISVAQTISGSLIVINGPGGQYVKVREAADEAVLRLLHLSH